MKRNPLPGNVRNVISLGDNSRGVITGKDDTDVQFESWNERKLLLLLSRDPTVEKFRSQPERFEYIDEEGHMKHYTPDFMVWRTNGDIEIHEVTLSSRRSEPNSRRREQEGRKVCRERGWRYIVHTEKTLPSDTETANLHLLSSFSPQAYSNSKVLIAATTKLHQRGGPMLLVEIVSEISGELSLARGEVTSALCHYLWHDKIMTDLHRLLFIRDEIAPGITVWIQSEEDNHELH